MDELDDLSRLAPRVDEVAARSAFERRRAQWRRRRRLGAVAGVGVVAAVAVVGVLAFVDTGEEGLPVVADGGDGTTTVTTGTTAPAPAGGEMDPACAELRVTGIVPDGFSASLAADGELTAVDGSDRSIEVRPSAEPSEVSIAIPWLQNCYLQLIGHGVTGEELAVFYGSAYVIGDDRMPVLDPRGAVWPETAQSQIQRSLPDDRLDPYATARAFAEQVLGWDDVIDERNSEPEPSPPCDMTLYLRRESDPDRQIAIQMSLAVGRHWWSVCRVPLDTIDVRIEVSGSSEITEIAGEAPAGSYGGPDVRYDYAGQMIVAPTGRPFELGFTPDTTGSAVVLFRNDVGEVIAAWARPLPAGDAVIGGDSSQETATGSLGVVVNFNGILGWSDGTEWYDPAGYLGGVPYEPGDEFTVVELDGTTRTAVAGDRSSQEICYPRGDNDIELDPPLPSPDLDPPDPIAVLADWDVVPRATEQLDVDSAEYERVVADYLGADGLPDVPIAIVQLLRTDLEGDGSDEVLIVAEHPEANRGEPPLAGWYSVVLVRWVVDGEVVTEPLQTTRFLEDDPDEYPTMAIHRVSAVADLNGDGRMEVVADTRYFESSTTDVYTVNAHNDYLQVVLSASCGA